jgi:hypothetical protein
MACLGTANRFLDQGGGFTRRTGTPLRQPPELVGSLVPIF